MILNVLGLNPQMNLGIVKAKGVLMPSGILNIKLGAQASCPMNEET